MLFDPDIYPQSHPADEHGTRSSLTAVGMGMYSPADLHATYHHHLVVGQNLSCLFVDGYHSTVVFLEGFLGVHRGTGVLTHSHLMGHLFGEVLPKFGIRRCRPLSAPRGGSSPQALALSVQVVKAGSRGRTTESFTTRPCHGIP